MKKFIMLVAAALVSSYSFADIQASSFSHNSRQLNALSSSWRTHHSVVPKVGSHDLEMVYGGADISRKPTIVSRTATA